MFIEEENQLEDRCHVNDQSDQDLEYEHEQQIHAFKGAYLLPLLLLKQISAERLGESKEAEVDHVNYEPAEEAGFEPDAKIISILIQTGLFIVESKHGVE